MRINTIINAEIRSALRTVKLLLAAVVVLMTGTNLRAQCPSVIWADEFTGSSLDLNKWSYQTGDGCAEGICGWGNNELQTYQTANVTVNNGQMTITAKKERIKAKNYTSGRIRTINKGDWTYGRYEALIRLPAGQGLWPAFWMLPTDEVYGGWPQSGEIDVMEFIGREPSQTLGYIHYGDPYPNNQSQGNKFVKHSGEFPGVWHEFAIEWEPGVIRWFVDGILFSTKTAADVSPAHWPFDQRFHIIMNIAVGGNLGGPVDDSIFPAAMDVEYVRVYDGFKPYISGNRTVSNQASGQTYTIGNVPSNTNVSWSVPAGATIVSGQGTPTVTVNWGTTSGNVTAAFSNGCSGQTLAIDVLVEPAYIKDFTFENFDNPGAITFSSSTGTHSEVSNPAPNTVNSSATSGKYIRNSAEQYDVLVYNPNSTVPDASQYTSKARKFVMDVLTSAPVGTEILLQLETADATSSNYPTGRHSRYIGKVTQNESWERMEFNLLDRPDGGASNTGITNMILLFASNTFTGDTYYYDNFDSYKADDGSGGSNAAPTATVTSPADGATFTTLDPISLSATASDSDGSVSQVEFFVNGQSAGVDASSPYQVSYTPAADGSYSLTATATDNGGATGTSQPVSFTVSTGGGTPLPMTNVINLSTVAQGPKTKAVAEVVVTSSSGGVSGALVEVSWSGDYTGTASGSTASNGAVTFETPSIRNAANFTITINNITKSGYTWDQANSQTSASVGSAGRFAAPEVTENRETGIWQIDAYPNPASDVLNFRQSQALPVQVKVFSFTGQVLMIRNDDRSRFEVNVSNLAKGVYYYHVYQGEAVSIGKFIKE